MATLQIDVPDDVLDGMNHTEAEALAHESLLVKLYQRGSISSGRAAALLDIPRRTFLEVLGRYGVSYFDDTMDVAAEAQHD
jgi:predicted HTH domain antitoxin